WVVWLPRLCLRQVDRSGRPRWVPGPPNRPRRLLLVPTRAGRAFLVGTLAAAGRGRVAGRLGRVFRLLGGGWHPGGSIVGCGPSGVGRGGREAWAGVGPRSSPAPARVEPKYVLRPRWISFAAAARAASAGLAAASRAACGGWAADSALWPAVG